MAHTQMTDLNSSEFELTDELAEELTDEELLAINGGEKSSDWMHCVTERINKQRDWFLFWL